MIETAFYDTKPYDRHFFTKATDRIRWRFHEFPLSAATAAAQGAQTVCVFVHDVADQPCLTTLAQATTANVLKLETGEVWLPGTAL